jgi:CubicO group peptidase (beta-lactamase class C family)
MRLLRLMVLAFAFAAALRAQPVAVAPESLGVPELMAKFKVPAVSVAVIRDFKVEWARAWGVKSARTGEAATVDTLFQAASISKPVAAMASLRAVQDGRITLDQDINTILKSWRLPARPSSTGEIVTPRMLLSHTSGTDDGFGFPGYHPDAPRPSIVQILDGEPPANRGAVRVGRPPMTGYKYSGGAVTIQELALTDLLGKPFPRIMREMVLTPIGMTNSTYDQPLPPDRQAHAAHAHDRNGQPGDAPWRIHPEHAAAGLWTTPTDLAKFAITRRQQLGLPLRAARASIEGLRRGDHDQWRQRRRVDQRAAREDHARVRVGHPRQASPAVARYFAISGLTCSAICSWVANQTPGFRLMYWTSRSSMAARERWPMKCGCIVRRYSPPSS